MFVPSCVYLARERIERERESMCVCVRKREREIGRRCAIWRA